MFTAFIGLDDDEETELCIRGNGKTCSMTFYLFLYFLDNYEVWTNYFTTFSTLKGFQQMITDLREIRKDEDLRKVPKDKRRKIVFGVTEMQDLINSMGSTVEQTLFVDSFTNQMRKLDADCLYDTQIFKNVHIRLRRHTENKRIPFKFHLDGSECNFDRCEKKHFIKIYSLKPFKKGMIRKIKAWEVGKLYNSKEMIEDILEIPKREKIKKDSVKNGD
jgi:hypothetical protein